jgi:hypothetical protein
MSNVNINWRGIRALNGSQSNGFEELCAQLARGEAPANSDQALIVSNGAPAQLGELTSINA